MAPSAIVNKPETSHVAEVSSTIEILPLRVPVYKPTPSKISVPVQVKDIFKRALMEQNRVRHGSRTLDAVISVLLHVAIIAAPVLASLYFTDTINLKQFAATTLVAPLPPPPPPPPVSSVVKVAAVHHILLEGGKLMAPKFIPRRVAEIQEAPLPDIGVSGVTGGVPGGVPGGQIGGVLGGVLGGLPDKSVVPLAPTNKPRAPIRVGGHIRAPRPLVQPPPVYPVLAKQVHLTGKVIIDTTIDEQGNVVNMKVVSGPPLLYAAAMEALRHWKYEPTYLNDVPISVQMIVTITFQLNNAQ